MRRVLQREQHVLRNWQRHRRPAFLVQQLGKRAGELRLRGISRRARSRLDALAVPHFTLDWRTGLAPDFNLVHDQSHVNDCALLPGGTRALTVSYEGPLREWDLETGENTRSAPVGEMGAEGLAVSRDGRVAVVSPADGEPFIWDVARWGRRSVLAGNGRAGWAVDVSPDGALAVTASAQGIAIWDTGTGRRIKKLGGRGGEVLSLAVTPDGKRVISGGKGGDVILWDLRTRKQVRKLGRLGGEVWTVAATGEGWVAASEEVYYYPPAIAVWSPDGEIHDVLEGHTSIVRVLAFDPGEPRLWSASGDATLRLWDLARERDPIRVQAHAGYVRGLDVSADGARILTAADDGTSRVWDREEIETFRGLPSHGGPITFIGMPPDANRVITASWDGNVHVRNAASGRRIQVVPDEVDLGSQVRSAAMTPDGKRLLLGGDNALSVREASGEQYEIGHVSLADAVALTPDGRLGICAGFPREVTLWDLDERKRKATLLRAAYGRAKRGPSLVWAVALSVDGRYAFAGVEGLGLLSWDLKTGKRRKALRKDREDQTVLCAPDGKHLVCAPGDGGVDIVRIPRGNVVQRLETGTGRLVAMSRGGRYLVTAREATLRVWDLVTGSCVATYGADSEITSLAIGPEGERIAVGDDVGRLQMLRVRGLRLSP